MQSLHWSSSLLGRMVHLLRCAVLFSTHISGAEAGRVVGLMMFENWLPHLFTMWLWAFYFISKP